jgi:RNA polymerase sigma-32 factor
MLKAANAPTQSPIQYYFRDMQKYDLLGREEEKELARRYREKNDQVALHRLVKGNLRLVVKIAKDFWISSGGSLLDLIQEGNVGLIQAAKKFDPLKQTKFSYYASFWIKAYIHKFIMDNHRSVRIGTTQAQRKLFFNLRKVRSRLAEEGVEPTPGTIARRLDVPVKDVIEMQQRLDQPDASLNATINERKNIERVDTLHASSPSVEEKLEDLQLKALVKNGAIKFKKRLDRREKAILERRILSMKPDTLQTLGNQFGVSRERIRQVEGRIVEKFKDYLYKKNPDIKQCA